MSIVEIPRQVQARVPPLTWDVHILGYALAEALHHGTRHWEGWLGYQQSCASIVCMCVNFSGDWNNQLSGPLAISITPTSSCGGGLAWWGG